MSAETITVTLAVHDPEAKRIFQQAARECPGVHLNRKEPGPVDLLVFEPGAEPGAELDRLERARRDGRVGEVFLVGREPSPELLIRAIRAGVTEFLPLPASERDLAEALARSRERRDGVDGAQARETGRVLAVLGAKPGVGASTVAVNLALEANRGRPGRVGLLDLREPRGETPYFLDLECSYTWEEVANNLARLDDTFLDSIITRHSSGLGLLPAPEAGHARLDGQGRDRLLAEMSRLFDLLVLDAGVAGEQAVDLMRRVDGAVLVLNPTLPCLARARAFLEELRRQGLAEKVRLAMNRHLADSEIDPAEAADVLGHALDWLLPDDARSALSALNQGRAVSEAAPKSRLSRALRGMAVDLGGASEAPAARPGLLGLLRRLRSGGRTAAQGLGAA